MQDFRPVEEQLALLRRGAVDLVEEGQLRDKLERSREAGEPLTIKVGFDPTSPDLHLGHTVLLRKMRHFQDMGHRVIFLIGGFTAMIGDPTGKKATRPQLTREEVEANAETYRKQAYHVLDEEKTVIDNNLRWLDELGAQGMVKLAGSYTLARMLERDDFRTRLRNNQPISIHELLYPLAQAYDSVALEADGELGGHDQIFNLLVGRQLMKERGLEPQIVLTVPLLVGTDGVEKMSKSLGNAIGVDESAAEIYGKTMSIPDALMWDWFLLLTDVDEAELGRWRAETENGTRHPKDLKMQLARRLVSDFHDESAASRAEEEFQRIFNRGGAPEDMPLFRHVAGESIVAILADDGLAKSRSEARRLVQQGAVSIDGEKVSDFALELAPRDDDYLIKVGKRRFARLEIV